MKLHLMPLLLWASFFTQAHVNKNFVANIEMAEKLYKAGELKKVITLLEPQCQALHGPACSMIGAIYRDGNGSVDKNIKKAFSYMRIACDHNYAKACLDRGNLYREIEDPDNAVESYKKGCMKNNVGSCYNLATMYYFGDKIKQDLQKAKYFYQKACQLGDIKKACSRYKTLQNASKESSAKKFKRACNNKDAIACHNLGALYYAGRGVKQSYTMALELDKLACIYKYAMGCKNVGLMYYDGLGTDKNIPKSLEYFKAAGSLGEGSGFFNAGQIYQYGKGVTKDLKVAEKLYELGCIKMDLLSCVQIGRFFEKGILLEQNGTKASSFYKTACDFGEPKGCSEMAFLYFEGKVIAKNLILAKIYFMKACSLNDDQSCRYGDAIKVPTKTIKTWKVESNSTLNIYDILSLPRDTVFQ